ncbi:hypothetical protein RYA99_03205 [Pseudomonas syringae pv. actinidifoliorum]|nr:hypothetical protein [Pseudomonas syringae pv. actinidifoliorum]MDU8523577.1 hypothetical protein [Pseudomonas syringae pv. actinidifoliorum]MDU8525187.1 hypothetical protein [Pseudomonas syringae pv. actinidifoliorum]
MIDELQFSKDYEYTIELYSNNVAFASGTLRFGSGKFVTVQLKGFEKFILPSEGSNLNARTDTGVKFTLINCTIENRTIYADLVICGEVNLGVSKIIVRYADLSEWFMYDQDITGHVGESLTWSTAPPTVDATVKTSIDSFKITSEIYSSIIFRSEERVIKEHVNFIFSKDSTLFDFPEIKSKPHQLACLLSILIAYPISITSIWVTGINGYWLPAYFPAFDRPKKEFERNQFWRNSLIRRQTLDSHWPELFCCYYSSPHRESIWTRLAGMQRYQGFWEYKVLGYISLLDSYASSVTKFANIKPAGTKLATIDTIMEQIRNLETPPSDKSITEIEKILARTLPKNRKELTFLEKYEYVTTNTDKDILKIINLSEDEFLCLKKVRDSIAHGDAVDLEIYPSEKIFSITSKITLLLTFRALNEFGILAGDFIKSLYDTINTLRYNKGLNITHLERVLHPTSFFEVSQNLFEKISKFKGERINACFTLNKIGEIDYSEKHVALYKKWNGTHPRQNISLSETFGVNEQEVHSIDKMHVEHEGKIEQLICAWIIII